MVRLESKPRERRGLRHFRRIRREHAVALQLPGQPRCRRELVRVGRMVPVRMRQCQVRDLRRLHASLGQLAGNGPRHRDWPLAPIRQEDPFGHGLSGRRPRIIRHGARIPQERAARVHDEKGGHGQLRRTHFLRGQAIAGRVGLQHPAVEHVEPDGLQALPAPAHGARQCQDDDHANLSQPFHAGLLPRSDASPTTSMVLIPSSWAPRRPHRRAARAA